MNKSVLRTLAILFFVLSVAFVWAQPSGGGPGGGNGPCPAPPCNGVPIDGGIGILAAAGIAFGIKKLRENKKGE